MGDRLQQQLSAHKFHVERFEASDANLKELQTTISQLQMEEESMKKTLRNQISDIFSLNEENDRLKQQLMSIETLASQTKSLELENGRLRQQQQAAYDSHIEKVKEYELNIREKEKTITEMETEKENMEKELKQQISGTKDQNEENFRLKQ